MSVSDLLAQVEKEHSRVVADLEHENQILRDQIRITREHLKKYFPKVDPPPLPQVPEVWCKRSAVPQCEDIAVGPTNLPCMVQTEAWEVPVVTQSRESTVVADAAPVEGEREQASQRRRLRFLLGLPPNQRTASAQVVLDAVNARLVFARLHADDVRCAFREFRPLHAAQLHATTKGVGGTELERPDSREAARTDGIDLDALSDLLLIPIFNENGLPQLSENSVLILETLRAVTLDEVIDEVTRGAVATTQLSELAVKPIRSDWESRLNSLVTVVVIVNIVTMGVSTDYYFGHTGWFVQECFCTAVFVFEATFKIMKWGPNEYFRGQASWWNWLDFLITVASVGEVALASFTIASPTLPGPAQSQLSSTAKVAVVGRILRLTRVLRLVKLVNSPVMKHLANILAGFTIGMPAMFWVLVCFSLILYVFGLVFRQLFGPPPDQDEVGICGPGDLMASVWEEINGHRCGAHILYGEEFFGTVSASMFTAFRFMLGDYSTSSGKSMIVALSNGYGKRFDVVFVFWMIVVIFGFFNIITAIFVEATTTGLKHNDVKRKYARQYERHYVKAKLKTLMSRVQMLVEGNKDKCKLRISRGQKVLKRGSTVEIDHIDISGVWVEEEEFVMIMQDPVVADLLSDLDIEIFNPSGLFDAFDAEGLGVVSMPSMVRSIVKLRGEPQKNDIIASWTSLRALHSKVDHMRAQVGHMQQAGSAFAHQSERPPSR